MPSKHVAQLKLLLSTFFFLLIVGAWIVLSFFFEADSFSLLAYAAVAGFFLYAVMWDAHELSKYSS